MALSAETETFITLIGMIEENWDPVQQEHFITCCTVLQIQLSPAEGLNGPPRVALQILKDYKSTCPEPAGWPLTGHGEEAAPGFQERAAEDSWNPRKGWEGS